MAEDVLSSPSTKTRKALSMSTDIPLNSPSRTRPIHNLLPEVKVPNSELPATAYHPVTCEPLTPEDLTYHKFQALQKQYNTPESARVARDEAVAELRRKLEDRDRKEREIEKEITQIEKTREIERKVFERQQQAQTLSTRG